MHSNLNRRPTPAAHSVRSRRRSHNPVVEPLEGRALLSGAGSLDPTFGTGGTVTTAITSGNDVANEVMIQPDGKIVAVGTGMARYNANGSLDTSFGRKGQVTGVGANAAALYPVGSPNAGKIIAAGPINSRSTGDDFGLVRYNADGSLDATFGSQGKATVAFGTGTDQNWGVALQPDGKIVTVGFANIGATRVFALARFNANGSLDTTFGVGGKATVDVGATELLWDVAVQADGKIIACGSAGPVPGGGLRAYVLRYNANGTLDNDATTGFGPDHSGIVVPASGGEALGVTLQGDGKIVVGGYNNYVDTGQYQRWYLARLNPDGNLDGTFGSGGFTTTQVTADPAGTASIWALALQPDGKIVAGGTTTTGFSLARYNTDGGLDTVFGAGGIVTTVIGSGVAELHALALQPDGKIVAAGRARIGQSDDFAVARYVGASTTLAATPRVPQTAIETVPGTLPVIAITPADSTPAGPAFDALPDFPSLLAFSTARRSRKSAPVT